MKTNYRGKHLQVLERDGWEFVERVKGKEAAVIVARTDDGRVILTEQFRSPVGAKVIDFPAGLIGDELGEENPAEAARRELEEETGYGCDQLELIALAPTSPGITSEIVKIYRARGLVRHGPGGGIDDEKITVHLVSMDHLPTWLQEREAEGMLVDVKVWAGMYFLLQST